MDNKDNFSTDEHLPPTSKQVDEALGQADGSGSTEPDDATNSGDAPKRKLVGLVAGRIVNYVMKGFGVRPLLIVNPGDGSGSVNGVLFFDGISDGDNFPAALGTVTTIDTFGRQLLSVLVKGVPHDFEGAEGSWHFPWREPAPMAAGVSAEVLNTLLEAKLAAFYESLDEKLQATVDTCNQIAENSSKLVKEALEAPAPAEVTKAPMAVAVGGASAGPEVGSPGDPVGGSAT
jgi:hypothetical protein